MNRDCYRLVFSDLLNAWVPVAETLPARGKRSRTARRLALASVMLSLHGLAAAATLTPGTLPNCPGGVCAANIQPTVTLGGSGALTYAVSGTSGVINQNVSKVSATWNTFDIAANAAVTMNQPKGAAALFRVLGGQFGFTQIEGSLKVGYTEAGKFVPGGSLFLLNQNGVLFANGASVDAGTLVASSLRLSDDKFNKGILTDKNAPAFGDGDPASGFVKVEQGATLTAYAGGKIMLLAPQVENAGTLAAPDGQVVLAAGSRVYLASSEDNAMRGLWVEVDNPDVASVATDASGLPTGAGVALNSATGQITTDRGNTTMIGLAVNQMGRISAKTAVAANGSIRLLARDTTVTSDPNSTRTNSATRAGKVTLGSTSVTETLPDTADTATSVDAQTFNPSQVEVMGSTIEMKSGAAVVAPGGKVTLTAGENPTAMSGGNYNYGDGLTANTSRILLEQGSTIDVSGSSVTLDMAHNVIAVELRGDELKDSPLLRYGVLRGTKVYIDIRKGTSIADISGYLAQVGRTVGERTTAGGSVTLSSEGDVVTQAGSQINISGGKINYNAGSITTSKLLSGGKLYDIGSASPDMIYDGVVSSNTYTVADKWGSHTYTLPFSISSQEAAYTDYQAGGTISVISPYAYLGGDISGAGGSGLNQRTGKATGGTLIVGAATPSTTAGLPDYRTISDVVLSKTNSTLASGWSASDALPDEQKATLTLSTDMLARSGLAQVKVYSNGKITVADDAALTLPAGGTLTLSGNSVDVRSDINVAAGTITLGATQTKGHDTDISRLTIRPDVTVAARGMWVNDLVDTKLGNPLGKALTGGGSITLTSYDDLILASGSTLDVSGGGQVSTSGKVSYGKGGDVSLTAQSGKGVSPPRPGGGLVLDGTVVGHSAIGGGTFSLTAGQTTIATSGSNPFTGNPVLEEAVNALATDGRFAGDRRLAYDAIVSAVRNGSSETDVVSVLQAQGYGTGAVSDLRATLTTMGQALGGSTTISSLALTQGGFSKYALTGLDGLNVSANTSVSPHTESFVVDTASATKLTTGSDLRSIATLGYLPDWQRPAASLTLTAGSGNRVIQGNLVTGSGSRIVTDPGAAVTLTARNQMTLQGEISAAGGTVTATLEGTSESASYDDINQSIWMTDSSRISTAGTFVKTDDGNRLTRGKSYAGGTVNINAKVGYVVSEAGSLIDVSGASAAVDSSRVAGASGVVATSGGSVAIAARRGVYLDGRYAAAGGNSDVQGGTLTVALDSKNLTSVVFSDDANARILDVLAGGSSLPGGLNPGDALNPLIAGSGAIRADRINTAGFNNVTLKAEDGIHFPASVNLQTPLALTLNTPELQVADGASVALAANTVTVANTLNIGTTVPHVASLTPASGSGTLDVAAATIDLVGPVSLSGVASATFTSQGDIRLGGILPSDTSVFSPYGALATAGDLSLSARRLYPTTLTTFDIESAGTVNFSRTGVSTAIPYSVGGNLNVHAVNIVQDGTLRAPFGSIGLSADNSLDLMPGSITSVSAEGTTIPFGLTQNGSQWAYDFGDRIALFAAPPQGSIKLNGSDINLHNGATVSAAGGGNLSAREFTAGPGGSKDVLADTGTYALVPSWSDTVAPVDYQFNLTSNPLTGQRIYISGGSGLAAGFYTLLPAAYALQPGGYAIKLGTANIDIASVGSSTKTNGASTVSGYLVNADGSRSDTRWSSYTLTPGNVIRTQSEYAETTATTFYSALAAANHVAVPSLPTDAGSISFSANHSMALDGTLQLAAAAGGQRGSLDIAAPNILVTANDSVTAPSGTIAISAQKLNAYQIGSLMLGGTRNVAGDQTMASVVADSVTVSNDSSSALTASEITLVAKDRVTVSDGAVISASGAVTKAPTSLLLTSNTGGNDVAAAVRLSSGDSQLLSRNGAVPTSSLDGAGLARGVFVGNATLTSSGALQLDSLYGNRVDGAATLTAHDISLAASRIGIGAGASTATDTLAITPTLLASMSGLNSLTLRSFSSVDLYAGDAGQPLGLPTSINLKQLTIDTPLLQSAESNVDASFSAANIALTNTTGVTAPGSAGGSGSLTLFATGSSAGNGRIVIGSGAKTIAGFETVNLTAERDIVADGNGSLNVAQTTAGTLQLSSGLISGSNGSQQNITGGGAVDIVARGSATPTVAGVGGNLAINGARIAQGGHIDMAGGTLSLNATGTDAGDNLVLQDGSTTRARGVGKWIHDYLAQADAGTINLSSASSDVVLESGAEVNVSADAGKNAGTVSITAAQGHATVNGTLLGQAGSGGKGGEAKVDARTLGGGVGNDLAALNTTLKQGGFDQAIDIRARQGDLNVAAGSSNSIVAKSVTLAADDGNVSVAGTIDASGPTGGSIALYAKDNGSAAGRVILQAGGELLARGTGAPETGSNGNGGKIVLSGEGSVADQVRLDGGIVDISATDASASSGTILLRAPRIGTTAVAIAPINSTVLGNGVIDVEANRVYSYNNSAGISIGTAASSTLTQSTLKADTQAFMSNAATIESALTGTRSDISVVVRPGVEVRNTGNITITADLNLASKTAGAFDWRYGANQIAGTLTLRSGGNLNINSNINDGLSKIGSGATLLSGDSWSYRLAGGSDLSAANPLNVAASSTTGDVVLTAGKSVRTGVGHIDVAAGRNVTLGNVSSASTVATTPAAAASIYTVGESAWDGSTSLISGLNLARSGGDVSLTASGDIVSVASNQLINNWFYRQGGEDSPVAWGPNYDALLSVPVIGALAGGNVRLNAGGNVINISANASNSAYVNSAGTLTTLGSGNLDIRSAGDIRGGVYFVANGDMNLGAGHDVGNARTRSGKPIYPILALMNARASVSAANALTLETVVNPTLLPMVSGNLAAGAYPINHQPFFSTYDIATQVKLTAAGGNLSIDGDASLIKAIYGSSTLAAATYIPGQLNAVALNGDVRQNGSLTLAASPVGGLDVVAAGSVVLSGIQLRDVMNLPSTSSIQLDSDSVIGNLYTRNSLNADGHGGYTDPVTGESIALLHALDSTPVRIYADTGDVTGGALTSSKAVSIKAGRDIVDLNLIAQNLADDQETSLLAGRDIKFNVARGTSNQLNSNLKKIEVAGSGVVSLTAGRNVDLGNSDGVVTVGNLRNPALPDRGASIIVTAGAAGGGNVAAVLNAYVNPASANAERATEYAPALLSFVKAATGNTTITAGQAWSTFQTLAPSQQATFARKVFFAELKAAGDAYNAAVNPDTSYARGYAAIETLFPSAASYAGDINLFFSQLKTQQGGDIHLFAPGGKVVAGLTNVPAELTVNKQTNGLNDAAGHQIDDSASRLGIMTLRGGDIMAMTRGDFLVNQSRVFTLFGTDPINPQNTSDILLWSTTGNIDAGKGKKTAVSAPPPVIRTDSQGNVVVDSSAAVSGSGIGSLLTVAGNGASNVDLIAPNGEVNAGDAGIRVSGNLTIAAQHVTGLDNIQVGGTSSGVPASGSGSVVASTAGLTNSEATRGADGAAAALGGSKGIKDPTSIFNVEIAGFGDDDPRKKSDHE